MPYHEDGLPDLGAPEKKASLLDILGGNWRWKNGLVYDGEHLDTKIGSRGVRLKLTPEDQMLIDLMMRYNGDVGLQTKVPLLGGDLQLNYNNTNGNNRYGIQWGRTF